MRLMSNRWRARGLLGGTAIAVVLGTWPLTTSSMVTEEEPAPPVTAVSDEASPTPQKDGTLVPEQPHSPLKRRGDPQGSDPKRGQTPAYAKGRFIVKFKPSLKECAHCLLERKRRFATALADRADSLDRLNQQCQVRGATSLFIERCRKTTLQAQSSQRQAFQAAKQKFPKRAAHAPQHLTLPDLTNAYVFEVPEQADIEAVCRRYQADPHVAYAQPDYRAEIQMIPNDPYYGSAGSWGQSYDDLWGLKKINAAQAWDMSQGAGTVVAVVDTGLNFTHPDIAANVWTNLGETPANGVDDDGNGFIDDVRGWDFTGNDNNPSDGNGHGTHVAGTIAAVGNNGIGIIGVAPQAKIMAVKGLNDAGSGTFSWLSSAIVYAATNGADVINNSWGCGGSCPSNPVAEDAVTTAMGLGAVVVFAAGNAASDVVNYSPQNMTNPKPIVVAATSPSDGSAWFTNVGVLVDVAAPGVDVLSLRASGTTLGPIVGVNYVRASGTSMAAPHVSGLVALVVASQPLLTIPQIKERLVGNSDDLGLPGHDANYGFGRINAAASLSNSQAYLVARVMAPAPGALIGTSVAIKGTAAAKQFSRYEIHVGQGSSPSAWQTTGIVLIGGGNSTVIDGPLATWGTAGLASGQWTIRLTVYNASGQSRESRIVVNLQSSLQGGWPQQVLYGGGSYNASMVAGDLEGDGLLEVVSGSYACWLYAWHQDGTRVTGFPVYVGGYDGNALTPALGDVDGDGDLEIAVGADTTHPFGVSSPDLHLLNRDGTELPGWPKRSANYIADAIVMADLDGDSDLELIVGEEDWKVHAYHHTGTPVAGWPVSIQYGQNVSAVAVGDVDGDGQVEVLATDGPVFGTQVYGNLYAWHRDGAPVSGWPVPIEGSFYQPVLGDVDGDGDLEVVVRAGVGRVLVFRGDGTMAPGWPKVIGTTRQGGFPCLGDLDGDGVLEIAIAGDDDRVHVFNGDGSYVPGWPRAFGFFNPAWVSACTIGDLDGDGQRELVLPAYDSWGGTYALYAFNPDGTVVSGWPKLDVDYFQSPVLTDVEKDGDVEVIAMAPYRGSPNVNVYVWGLPGAYDPATMDWPMLGQNPAHTSRLTLSASPLPPTVVFSEDFESGASGWAMDGLWHLSQARSNSPTTSAAYNDGIDYDTGARNSGSVTSPPIDLTAATGATLKFSQWHQTENAPLFYDIRQIRLSTDGGATWTLLKQLDDLNSVAWTQVALSLSSAAGKTLRLRFFFDTIDPVLNRFEGWYVDDVKVEAILPDPTNHPPALTPIGNKTVPEGQLLSFTVSATDPDGDPLTYSASGLPAGAAFDPATQTFSWTPGFDQAGSYPVTFTVSDGTLTAAETVTMTVTDVPRPDLTLITLSTTTTVARPGKSVVVANTVKNQGTMAAGSHTVSFVLSTDPAVGGTDDVSVTGTRTITSLAIGASSATNTTITLPGSTPLGTYYVCAVVDAANTVAEETETNNSRCTATTLQVTQPELLVTAVSSQASAVTGGSLAIDTTVTNSSPVASPSFYLGLYLSTDAMITTSDLRIGYRYVSLAANASSTATTTVTIPTAVIPGTYTLGAIADYSAVVPELSETNNSLAGTAVTITPGADLVVTAVSGPTTGVTGAPIALTTTVVNQGTGNAGGFSVALYLSRDATITTSDLRLGTRSLSSLAIGASSTATTTVTIPPTLAPGTYTLGAIADYSSRQLESSEVNNALAGNAVTITIGADLVMTALSGPATATKGTTITIPNTVTNQGTGSAGGFYVSLYLSSDPVITTADRRLTSRFVGSLAAGASSTAATAVTIPTTLTSGTYILGAIADSSTRAPESNETNNSLAGHSIVVPP